MDRLVHGGVTLLVTASRSRRIASAISDYSLTLRVGSIHLKAGPWSVKEMRGDRREPQHRRGQGEIVSSGIEDGFGARCLSTSAHIGRDPAGAVSREPLLMPPTVEPWM